MLKRSLVSYAGVVVLAAGFGVQLRAFGQQPASSAPPTSGAMVHFEGCVFTESALTASPPVLMAPSGTQTYVLTDAKHIAGKVSEEEVAKTIYTLDKVDQAEMRSNYGKRVGVVGNVASGSPRPKLEVASIREISGGCPAVPAKPQS